MLLINSNSNSNDTMSMLPPTQRPVAHYNVNVRINNKQLVKEEDSQISNWFALVQPAELRFDQS